MSVRHLYVHLPFCAHRCGYCDFVTATGRDHLHGPYVDALLRELGEEHDGSLGRDDLPRRRNADLHGACRSCCGSCARFRPRPS